MRGKKKEEERNEEEERKSKKKRKKESKRITKRKGRVRHVKDRRLIRMKEKKLEPDDEISKKY